MLEAGCGVCGPEEVAVAGGAKGVAAIPPGLLEAGCGTGRGTGGRLGEKADADCGGADITAGAAAWGGGGKGVATMLAEYPPEDAA